MISGLLLGMSKAEVLAKIDDIIEFSELGDFIDEPVEAYSAGMKTRLGFSTALYIQPDILLIDEVLGVGDRKFKEKSYNALKKKLSGEMAAVIVSHDEEEILDLCDRVIWIDQGVCRLSGDPHYVINEMNASS